MEAGVSNARVLPSVAPWLLVLLCGPIVAVRAEPVPQLATIQGGHEVDRPGVAADEQRLKQIDQWIREAKYAQAADAARNALASLESAGRGDSPVVCDYADRLIQAVIRGGEVKSPEALAVARRCVALDERLFGADDVQTANGLVNLARVLGAREESREAGLVAERAVGILERASSPNDPRLGDALRLAGLMAMETGDLSAAKTYLTRALETFDAALGPMSVKSSAASLSLATYYWWMGDYAAAVPFYERSLSITVREFGPDHPRVAAVQYNYSIVKLAMGDYERAAQLCEAAERTYEQTVGPWHPDLALALNNHAQALRGLGRYPKATALQHRALEIQLKAFGPDSGYVENSLNNLANDYLRAGDPHKAMDLAKQAVAIAERSLGLAHPQLADALQTLALSLRGLNRDAEALALSERALRIREDYFGAAHPETANTLVIRSRLLIEAGQAEAARASALNAERMSRENLALMARTLTEAQALSYATSRYSGLNLLITMAVLQHGSDAETVRASWDSQIGARALVLDEMAVRRQVRRDSTHADIAQLVAELRRSDEILARLIVSGPNDQDVARYRAAVEDARKAKQRAELALAAHSEQFRQDLARNHAGLSDVRAALPPDAALVAYVRYGRLDLSAPSGRQRPPLSTSSPSYAAFILSAPSRTPIVVPLGEAVNIDGLVARWRAAAVREAQAAGRASKAGEASYRKVAEELRRVVWDSVANHLGTARQVLIVPDGALHLVDFAALPVGGARYLVEEGRTLHYMTAERDLLAPASADSRGGLLALSNPDFDDRRLFAALAPLPTGAPPARAEPTAAAIRGLRSACGSFQSMRFQALPASAQEAKEIASIWDNRVDGTSHLRAADGASGTGKLLEGAAANETMFKRTAGGHGVLHLATHGFFLGGDCESALDSSDADSASSASSAVTRENPLLLSGLVLAGANHRDAAGPNEDDGILTAEEIATLDLRGTEWAVLSACDTGNGEIRAGEGVFGLRRAFQLAGARTVIMSLWPVEDQTTLQWMAALYRHRFVEHESTAASVNGASLELLQQRRARGESTHPFHWAGFIAAGDWR